jgi:CheY-specific phosphatase CheX
MMTLLKKTMETSISEVFETMFYESLDFDTTDAPRMREILDTHEMLAFQIQFEGSFSGSFALCIPRELALRMTENFMGEAPENITDEHLDQMIKEIANMVAGNTFSHLNDQVEFKLSIPRRIDNAVVADIKNQSDAESYIWIETAEGFLVFKITINP